MQRRLFTALSFLLVLALVLPAAAAPFKGSFKLFKDATLAGTALKAGEYRLVAEDSTVTIFRGGEKVLETQVTWVSGEKQQRTSVVTSGEEIQEIRIRGQEGHLKFGQ